MDSPTEILSEYIASVKFEDIPKDVVGYAKDLILDSIGCAIGGAALNPGAIVVDFFTELGGRPEASILATGSKLPCINAAYVNSYLSNLLDFDDTGSVAPGHPGATIIPPGLALAEEIRASGKDFITAVVLAYEGWGRISRAIAPSPERRAQVWGFGTHQILGAAIVSSKLLKFNSEQTANALGLAGVSASVPAIHKEGLALDDRPVTWAKNNFGWASMGGVLSALLTQRGFVGNKHILDGEKGFWIMAGSDQCDFGKMTLNLGTDYLTSKTAFKPYASCRWAHSSLDAITKIMATNKIDVTKIKSIQVQTFSGAVEALGIRNPASILDAQFSLPHLIALELLGRSSREGLSADDLNPKVRALAEKVSMEVYPEIEERFEQDGSFTSAVVCIEQEDSSLLCDGVDVPRGEGETRPTREELHRKFTFLAAPIIGVDASQAIIGDLEQLEKLKDVSAMISRIAISLRTAPHKTNSVNSSESVGGVK